MRARVGAERVVAERARVRLARDAASCAPRLAAQVEANAKPSALWLREGGGPPDALLFGGPCRFVKHAVLDVNLNELPAWMAVECGAEPYRLSLTFRDATSVLGREEFFRRFDVSKGWFRQTQRAWRPGNSLIDAQVEGA